MAILKCLSPESRRLYPKYPGAFDESAFLIGRTWCQSDYAYFEVDDDDEDGPCPLNEVCPKNITLGIKS